MIFLYYYRFWKEGYWRNHLQGRKYHISALYVVDLKRFRRIAAGDRLRGQYQALSTDPNSLANLDQDLPNNMIHQVAIKSLPQEWLWCETWCDDKSKKTAKTIDLVRFFIKVTWYKEQLFVGLRASIEKNISRFESNILSLYSTYLRL